ncbi:sodium:proline symporter [Halorubrum sp. BV1]|uniref:sodium:solute symporter family transporter n=1 Tax=Halorubrum sp. BV1 TaxID=1498500 RepID=UPI0009B5B64E|nr:sodium:proline symporter [Halorubrum sp. BV1]
MVSTELALAVTVVALGAFTVAGVLHARGRVRTLDDYVTARSTTGPAATTATLVASVMGAWILLAPAEAGAAFGGLPAVLGYAIGSAVPFLLFVPVGLRVRKLLPEGHSLTEFALARYGRSMYALVVAVSIFYMSVFLAAELTGVAAALSLVAEVPQAYTAALIGGFVLLYTAYGGLVASVFTDTLQAIVILPLLAVSFAGAVLALGGAGSLHAAATSADPTLLDPTFGPGVAFGVYVAFAVLGANMLNQGVWQRVYAARDDESVRRGFVVAAVAVIPLVLLAGLFGIASAALGLTADGGASVAFFLLVVEAFPEWVALSVVVLAVLLVASSADTMCNAIASLVTVDLARVVDAEGRTLGRAGRLLTALVAVGAAVVGAQGYSVLALFLTADLVAAAVFVPFLAGLWSTSLSDRGAVAASLVGLAVGIAYFPQFAPALAALPIPTPTPSFLVSFAGATIVSTAATAVAHVVGGEQADLGTLGAEIRRLDSPMTDGGVVAESGDGDVTAEGGDERGTRPTDGDDAAERTDGGVEA